MGSKTRFHEKLSLSGAVMKTVVPRESIVSKIIFLRGEKVLLDRDLAVLYGVETKVLKQAVRRNIRRFPSDFMFELSKEEFEHWRSQFVTSNSVKMGLRYNPMAFTEQGVAYFSRATPFSWDLTSRTTDPFIHDKVHSL